MIVPDNDSNVKVSQQKLKFQNSLVMTLLYTNRIFSSLYPLKDSIIWDSNTACYNCNNLDYMIILLELLKEEILISTASRDKLIIEVTNMIIKY